MQPYEVSLLLKELDIKRPQLIVSRSSRQCDTCKRVFFIRTTKFSHDDRTCPKLREKGAAKKRARNPKVHASIINASAKSDDKETRKIAEETRRAIMRNDLKEQQIKERLIDEEAALAEEALANEDEPREALKKFKREI